MPKKTKKKGPAGKAPKKVKIPAKVTKYLDNIGVPHDILEHRTVYTAIDAALTMRKKMDEIIKSLIVKADKDYYLVLLPADHNLDFEKLKAVIGKDAEKEIKVIKIPGEKLVQSAFKAKAQSITAFGELHKVGVVMEKKLEKLKKAVFAAGTPNYSVEMKMKDYKKTQEPIVGSISKKKKVKIQKSKK
jgi:Ala-tRNA(Pro) deacylase